MRFLIAWLIKSPSFFQYRPPGIPPCSPPLSIPEEAHNFYEILASCLIVVRQWAEKIPGFCSLCQEDQTTLVESAFVEIFVLRLAYRLVLSLCCYFSLFRICV